LLTLPEEKGGSDMHEKEGEVEVISSSSKRDCKTRGGCFGAGGENLNPGHF